MCLNSFRGKLTELQNRPKSNMNGDTQELFRFPATPGIELTSFLFAGDEVVWVMWKYVENEENMPAVSHTNEMILTDFWNKQSETKFKNTLADRLAESAQRLVSILKGGGRKRKRETCTPLPKEKKASKTKSGMKAPTKKRRRENKGDILSQQSSF